MASIYLFLLFFTISPPSVTSYSYTDFITASVGSSVTLSCHSMFVTPHWRWTSARALWARSTKNPDVSAGPLARPFARSLAPLTRSLAPHYSLRSRAPLRSLARSLPHFAHSLARGKVIDEMAIFSGFYSILAYSAGEEWLALASLSFN